MRGCTAQGKVSGSIEHEGDQGKQCQPDETVEDEEVVDPSGKGQGEQLPMKKNLSQPYLCDAAEFAGSRCRFFHTPRPAAPFPEERECHVPERDGHG